MNEITMNKELKEFLAMDLADRVQAALDRIQSFHGLQYSEMGYELLDCGKDDAYYPFVEYLYVAKPSHRNNYEGVYGGMICGVFDTCMGMSATAVSGQMVTTSDLTVNFLRAAMGTNFRIRIEFTHIGGRNINSIGKMIDRDTDELIATAVSTFAVLRERPVSVAMD